MQLKLTALLILIAACSKVNIEGAEQPPLLKRSEASSEQLELAPSHAATVPQPKRESMVLDIFSGGTLMYRFLDVEQWGSHHEESNTGTLTRSGYGILDQNQNYLIDNDEKRVYFEFNEQTTEYLFYHNPAY